VLAWICLVIAVNQLGFGSIVPIVPLYAAAFGVPQVLIGLAIAVYGLARFAASVPAGWLADRAGRRWSLAGGGAVTVAGNLICGLASTYDVFLLGRFVAGSGAAMVLTSGQVVLADITSPDTRGRTMGFYMAVFLFAVGIGPLPGGLLAELGGLAFPFYTYAALGSVVALLALWRLPETRPATLTRTDGRAHQSSYLTQVGSLLCHRPFLLVSLVSFAAFFARTGALFALVPLRAQHEIGLNPAQIGLGLALVSVLGLLGAYPSGLLVDLMGRKAVIVPSTLLSGTGLVGFALAPSYGWFLLACLLWALASGIAGAAPAAYAADVAPRGMNAAAMSTYRMLADSGYVVGPTVLGWLGDLTGTTITLQATAALVVVTGALFALFAPETYRKPTAQDEARSSGQELRRSGAPRHD
jgi:MFS family permease